MKGKRKGKKKKAAAAHEKKKKAQRNKLHFISYFIMEHILSKFTYLLF